MDAEPACSAPVDGVGHDDALDSAHGRGIAAAMVQARIRQRIKSSMQSGRAREGKWVLEYEVPYAHRADPLTGWAGSGNTRGQVTLGFPTLEAARAYADKHGLTYHVTPGQVERTLKIQTYSDNFKGPDLA